MGAEGASDIPPALRMCRRSREEGPQAAQGCSGKGSGGPKVKEAPDSTWIRLADQWGELEEGWPNRGTVSAVNQGVASLLGLFLRCPEPWNSGSILSTTGLQNSSEKGNYAEVA
ncbi:hypothetical protein R6Z07M_017034 [Ovis aries]